MKTKTLIEKGCGENVFEGSSKAKCGDKVNGKVLLCQSCRITLTQTNKIIELIERVLKKEQVTIKRRNKRMKIIDINETTNTNNFAVELLTKIKGEEE